MIANTYDIDLEACFRMKEELNRVRYGHTLRIDDIINDIFLINIDNKKYIVKIYNVEIVRENEMKKMPKELTIVEIER